MMVKKINLLKFKEITHKIKKYKYKFQNKIKYFLKENYRLQTKIHQKIY